MDELGLEQLQRNPLWVSLLGAYQDLSVRQRAQAPDFDGWTPRIIELTDVPGEELSGMHGKLIAFGFLKFDLAGRDAGIRYQLSPLGKQVMNGPVLADVDD